MDSIFSCAGYVNKFKKERRTIFVTYMITGKIRPGEMNVFPMVCGRFFTVTFSSEASLHNGKEGIFWKLSLRDVMSQENYMPYSGSMNVFAQQPYMSRL